MVLVKLEKPTPHIFFTIDFYLMILDSIIFLKIIDSIYSNITIEIYDDMKTLLDSTLLKYMNATMSHCKWQMYTFTNLK